MGLYDASVFRVLDPCVDPELVHLCMGTFLGFA